VKTLTSSKCHPLGRVLAFKQLEIKIFQDFVVNVDPKDLIQHPYCGLKNMWPSIVYTTFKDFYDGDFVFIRLHDFSLVPIWM
jgi:hypothetical protein